MTRAWRATAAGRYELVADNDLVLAVISRCMREWNFRVSVGRDVMRGTRKTLGEAKNRCEECLELFSAGRIS